MRIQRILDEKDEKFEVAVESSPKLDEDSPSGRRSDIKNERTGEDQQHFFW